MVSRSPGGFRNLEGSANNSASSPASRFLTEVHNLRDASTVGVGSVLTQHDQPIAYASRTLSAAEQNYTTTEREILAILAAVEKFKCFFTEKTVTGITDHAALTN